MLIDFLYYYIRFISNESNCKIFQDRILSLINKHFIFVMPINFMIITKDIFKNFKLLKN